MRWIRARELSRLHRLDAESIGSPINSRVLNWILSEAFDNWLQPSISGVITVEIWSTRWTSDQSKSPDEDPMDVMNQRASSHAWRGRIVTLHLRSDAHDLVAPIRQTTHHLDCWSRWIISSNSYARFFYKLECSSQTEPYPWILRLIKLSRHHNSSVNWFLSLLDTFSCPRSIWNKKLIERGRRNHILNANVCLRNGRFKSHEHGD